MLTREQQRDILATGLLALGVFILLALVPVPWFGARADEWFPSGNAMGVIGASTRTLFQLVFGGASFLFPILLALVGMRIGGWLSREWTGRLALLDAGLLALAPVTVWVLTESPDAAGWLGLRIGQPMAELVGWLGALLVTGVGLVALSVATLGWNPLRAMAGGLRGVWAVTRGAWALLRRWGAAVGRRVRAYRIARAEARALARAEAAAAALEAEEAGGGGDGVALDPAESDEADLVEIADAEGAPGAGAASGEPDGSREPRAATGRAAATPAPGVQRADFEMREPLARLGGEDDLLPAMDILTEPDTSDRTDMERELDRLGEILVEKLRTFNVECTLGGRTTGPVVTQFEVIPAAGVKVNRIASLDADLALAMKAPSVRIVAPIPGKGAVGVEIPNPRPEIVSLREILESPAFRNARGELPLALGKDLTGHPYVARLEKMPHVLIAGATGSGKSVCINTLITSLVYRHTPETLRLLMVDPKMVELSIYARLPHLRHSVVTDPRDAGGVLRWAVLEMERRYTLLKANHVRSLQEFNRKVRKGVLLRRVEPAGPEGDEDRWIYTDGVLPYLVIVVDELADLMMTVQSEVEKPLTQLAQKARAIGIHLIVATQRPSVNVITGLIKANFPTRIAFRVASKTDSRTILDQNGADALLGNGDMLFLPPGASEPVRIQGAYLPTSDTEQLMAWYMERQQRLIEEAEAAQAAEAAEAEAAASGVGVSRAEPDILEEVRRRDEAEAQLAVEDVKDEWDELFRAAGEVCIQNGGGSTSLLQRRLKIGYGRAARIVDQLQDAGVLGPPDGSKGREVLVSMEELDAICGAGGPGAMP